MFLQSNKQALLGTEKLSRHQTHITFVSTQADHDTAAKRSLPIAAVVDYALKILYWTTGLALIGMMLLGTLRHLLVLENLALLSSAVLIFLLANCAWEMGR